MLYLLQWFVHVCCKAYVPNVSSVFRMYVASVFISMLHMFHTYVVSVLSACCVCLQWFSSVFRCFCKCFRRMFQVFHLLWYVASVASRYFKSISRVAHGMRVGSGGRCEPGRLISFFFLSKHSSCIRRCIAGYLGFDVDPVNANKKIYHVVHQRRACHIINLIVKSGLKRLKPYIEVFRTAINFQNSSNQHIAQFKNYCNAKGVRPRKFALDMDVRWNSTYLMLKHLMPYRSMFSVFINTHSGYPLLNE